MKNLKLTKEQLTELCFTLLKDKLKRTKTGQKNFEKGIRKLLNELKELENA